MTQINRNWKQSQFLFFLQFLNNLRFISTWQIDFEIISSYTLTNYYIELYADKFKSLQKRITALLRNALKSNNARKSYSSKIKIFRSTFRELKFFQIIRSELFKSVFLVHFNSIRQLYIDLDFSKERNIETMIYHVHNDKFLRIILSDKTFSFIVFLNRLLSFAKIRYWSTELKVIEFVWI